MAALLRHAASEIISRLYLAYISPMSRLYLPYILADEHAAAKAALPTLTPNPNPNTRAGLVASGLAAVQI